MTSTPLLVIVEPGNARHQIVVTQIKALASVFITEPKDHVNKLGKMPIQSSNSFICKKYSKEKHKLEEELTFGPQVISALLYS